MGPRAGDRRRRRPRGRESRLRCAPRAAPAGRRRPGLRGRAHRLGHRRGVGRRAHPRRGAAERGFRALERRLARAVARLVQARARRRPERARRRGRCRSRARSGAPHLRADGRCARPRAVRRTSVVTSKRRPVVALLAAEIISTTGGEITAVALPWFVLVTTGSPARIGAVLAAGFLGMAVLGIPSGRAATALGPRRTMLVADAACAPTVALIPALHWAGLLSFPVIVAA